MEEIADIRLGQLIHGILSRKPRSGRTMQNAMIEEVLRMFKKQGVPIPNDDRRFQLAGMTLAVAKSKDMSPWVLIRRMDRDIRRPYGYIVTLAREIIERGNGEESWYEWERRICETAP